MIVEQYNKANRALRCLWNSDNDCEVTAGGEQCDADAWLLCFHAAMVGGVLAVLRILKDSNDCPTPTS